MSEAEELRRRAEERLKEEQGGQLERDQLVVELQIHQAELEMQNEELRRTRDELQAAHDRYFDLFELAPVGYLTLGRRGQVLTANLATSRLLGVTRDRLIGLSFSSLMRQSEADRFHLHLQAVFSEWGRKHALEVRVRRNGGELVAAVESVAYSQDGEPRCRMALVDVTERRRAEGQLREREVRLAVILETAVDGIVTFDEQGVIDSANAAANRLFGYPPGELVGRSVGMLMEPQHRLQLETLLTRYLGSGRESVLGQTRRAPAQRRDGSVFPVELTIGDLRGEKGRFFVAVARDVSERERREASQRESLSRFEQIADRIEDVFYIVEPSSGRLCYVSPAFARMFGRPLEEATGAGSWMSWVHPEDVARVRQALDRARSGNLFDEEYRILRADGSERRVRDRGYPLPGQDRLTGIVHDVTEERALQEGMRHAQRLETVGTLASGIAHDFNNLLMGLAGLGNMALRTLDPEHPATAHVRRAVEATMRGAALTRQLLVFSGQRRAEVAAIELDGAVLAARELIDRLMGEHIRVALETGAPGVTVVAEPGEIEQILLNLCSNARDAMAAGGELTVRTEVRDGLVSLAVRDTGHGMDAQTRARVFEPFFTTKEVGRGTGLGLSTVFALARQRGGQVQIESEPGRGTTVTVSLPVAGRGAAHASSPAEEPTGSESILVVEDDPLVRATLESYVSTLGYHTVMAAHPAEALRLLGEGTAIDLLLTDVVMPGRLGRQLAEEVERLRAGIPVLYMSAHPRGELERLGRVPPHSELLGKPFGRPELAHALRTALDRGARPARSVLIVDDNHELAQSLADAFQDLGCSVAIAGSAAEALRLAEERRPELVMCDLSLGEARSGLDVVRALRARDDLRGSSIVALTGFADAATGEAALAAGFDKVLTKPLDFDGLEALVRRPPRR